MLKIEELSFQKVMQFKTKKSIAENISLPIFIVQLDANSQLHKLQKVNRLCHHVITWEKLKKSETLQCKRCQRLGHVASNCNMKYRCVKCCEQHDPGKCKLSKDSKVDTQQLYCANCKEYGHPASYRGCPISFNQSQESS